MYSVEPAWETIQNKARPAGGTSRTWAQRLVAPRRVQTSNRYFPLCSVDVGNDELDQVTEKSEGWERIPMKVDSGAVDTVIPRSTAAGTPLKETVRSKTGTGFQGGEWVPHRALWPEGHSGVQRPVPGCELEGAGR